jgi:hypothetical protein
MVDDERYVEIQAGLEKIRAEKPYDDTSDAIAARDWLGKAINDLRKQLHQSTDDSGALARLHELLTLSESAASSIEARIKQQGDRVPQRHQNDRGTVVDR